MVFASIETHVNSKTGENGLQEYEADLILDYIQYLQNTKHISDNWMKNIYHLTYSAISLLKESGKDKISLDQVNSSNIQKAAGKIRQNKNFKNNYKRGLILALKNFFLWYSKQNQNLNPDDIKEIKLPPIQWKTKKPEDMLTKDEVLKIINACTTTRDKAIIAMLYDGSHRPIEVMDLRWNEIFEDEDGYYYYTAKKTGKSRRIRMTFAIPYFEMWRNNYPEDPSGDNYVFVTLNRMGGRKEHRPMTSDNIWRLMKILKERTGITKLKPSIFRPTKITHDVEDGYDLPYIMLKNWGNLKTNMIDVYSNVSDDYLDKEALTRAGLKRIEKNPDMKEIQKLQPIQCICGEICPPNMRFCHSCRRPLTPDARAESEELNAMLGKLSKEQIIELISKSVT